MEGKQLRFIADGGHGWLELPASEVVRLDLRDKLSRYCYVSRDGTFVYLEEDCAFDAYVQAKIARGEDWEIFRTETVHSEAFVRALPRYDPARLGG